MRVPLPPRPGGVVVVAMNHRILLGVKDEMTVFYPRQDITMRVPKKPERLFIFLIALQLSLKLDLAEI